MANRRQTEAKRESLAPQAAAPRPLTEAERAELAIYKEQNRARPHAPRFGMLAGAKARAGKEDISPAPGVDTTLFRARLASSFGAVDELAIGLLLSQAAYAVEGGDAVQQCNSAAAILTGIAPRNEIEGLLAVQMLAAHNLSMAMTRRALKTDRVDWMQRYGTLSAKLMNVFTRQLEALARLRGQTRQQTVRVEHVTVEAGGQAVVGAVTTGGSGDADKQR